MNRYLERLVDRLAPAPVAAPVALPRVAEAGDSGADDPFETIMPLEADGSPHAWMPRNQTPGEAEEVPPPVPHLTPPSPRGIEVLPPRSSGDLPLNPTRGRAADPLSFFEPRQENPATSGTPAFVRAPTEDAAVESVDEEADVPRQSTQQSGSSVEEGRLQRLEAEILKLAKPAPPAAIPPERYAPPAPFASQESNVQAAAPLRPAPVREPLPVPPAPAEPRLVIGRMRVEVVAAPAFAPPRDTVRVVRRAADSSRSIAGRRSNLRFGLEQL